MTIAARLAGVTALVLAILIAVASLPQTRDAAVDRAVNAAPGVTFGPARGSLLTGVRFDQVAASDGPLVWSADGVRLQLTPWGVLSGSGWLGVMVDRLHVSAFDASAAPAGVGLPAWSPPGFVHVKRIDVAAGVLPQAAGLAATPLSASDVRLEPTPAGFTVRGDVEGTSGASRFQSSLGWRDASGVPEFALEVADVRAFTRSDLTQRLGVSTLTMTGQGDALATFTAEAALKVAAGASGATEGIVQATWNAGDVTVEADGVLEGTRIDVSGGGRNLLTSNWTADATVNLTDAASGLSGTLQASGTPFENGLEVAWSGDGELAGQPWSFTGGRVRLPDGVAGSLLDDLPGDLAGGLPSGLDAGVTGAYGDLRFDVGAKSASGDQVLVDASAQRGRQEAAFSGVLTMGAEPVFDVQGELTGGVAAGTVTARGQVGAAWDLVTVQEARSTFTLAGATVELETATPLALGAQWAGVIEATVTVPGRPTERLSARLSERFGRPSTEVDVGGGTVVFSQKPSGRWSASWPRSSTLQVFGANFTAAENVSWEVGGWPAGAWNAELTGNAAGDGLWKVAATAPRVGRPQVWSLTGELTDGASDPVRVELTAGPPERLGDGRHALPLTLSGALSAQGNFTISQGSWRAELGSAQVQLQASGDAWTPDRIKVSVREAEVPAGLVPVAFKSIQPEVESLLLSLDVSGEWSGGILAWQPAVWTLAAGPFEANGTLQNEAGLFRLDGRVQGTFEDVISEGDLLPVAGTFNASWSGSAWPSAVLDGRLAGRLAGVNLAGAVADVVGEVRLSGTPREPGVAVRAEVAGDIEGVVTYAGALTSTTQGRLAADLAWQERSVELDVDLAGTAAEAAAGSITTPGGRWPLTQRGNRITAQFGTSGVSEATLTLGERWTGASARGRLAASEFSPTLDGILTWSAPTLAPLTLESRWREAAVGDVTLPDLMASGDTQGGTLTSSLGGNVSAQWNLREGAADIQGRGLNLGDLGTYDGRVSLSASVADWTVAGASGAWAGEATGRFGEDGWQLSAELRSPSALRLDANGGVDGVRGSLTGNLTALGETWSFSPAADASASGIQTRVTGVGGAYDIDVSWPGAWDRPAASLSDAAGVTLFRLLPFADDATPSAFTVHYDSLSAGTQWATSGSTALTWLGQRVMIVGHEGATQPAVSVSVADAVTARTLLRQGGLLASVQAAARDGVTFSLNGDAHGDLRWSAGQGIESNGISGELRGVAFTLSGGGTAQSLDVQGTLRARSSDAVWGAYAPLILGDQEVPVRALGSLTAGTLLLGTTPTADASPAGSARWSAPERQIDLRFQRQAVKVDASYDPTQGWTGRLEASQARVPVPGLDPTPVNASLRLEDGLLKGSFQATSGGSFVGTGQLDVPFALGLTDEADRSDFQVSLAAFDVRALPGLQALTPSLAGSVGARLQLRHGELLAEVSAPDLATPSGPLPVRLRASGAVDDALEQAEVTGTVAGSAVRGSINREQVSVWMDLERFPLERLIAARFGAVDAEATAVGVLHATVPWANVKDASVRLATEAVSVVRGDSAAEGVLNLEVTPERAAFDVSLQGRGRWLAEGSFSADALDVRLEVNDADATPFLGLIPALAQAGVSAGGSLTVQASGPLDRPRILVGVTDLRLGAYGGRYRIRNTSLRWLDRNLVVDGLVEGLDPLGGSLRVLGRGTVPSWDEGLTAGGFDLNGSLDIPLFGTLSDLQARIDTGADGSQRLTGQGDLGGPLQLAGTVRPFDLQLQGGSVDLSSSQLRLADTRGSANVNLAWDGGLVLAGGFEVQEGRYVVVKDAGPEGTGQAAASSAGPASGGSPLRFESVVIDVREATIDESFANGTFAGRLTLSGRSSEPRLQGSLAARQAELVLLGRTFEASQAEVLFEPSRGVLPILNVNATRTFRKRDALANTPPSISIEQPAGSTFEVDVAFSTEVLTATDGSLRLDVAPALSSNAVLQVDDPDTDQRVTRSLTDGELVTLVSVGRLDPVSTAAGGGLAESVASTTLEGTFETLVLRELSSALADATGLPTLAIETTSLGSSLTDQEPFGVSLRIGGTLEEGLFASYEFERTFSAEDALTGTTNRFELAYDLDPLSFDAATSVTIPSLAGEPATAALTTTANYRVTDWTSISLGAILEQDEQRASFGVSFRW